MGTCVIMAGGTGGHVFPALAVAKKLQKAGHTVSWIGTANGLEARVVPAAGIEVDWITVSGLRGKGLMGWLVAPFKVGYAAWQAVSILRRRKPNVVLGMGGFVAGPGGLASWLLRKPLVIHEQNAVAGLTNRVLARLASRVLQAFPGAFPERVGPVFTGNPVREDIASLADPVARFSSRRGPLRLLVFGGSLGAQALNETVPAALALLPLAQRPEVRHQSGERNLAQSRALYEEHAVTAQVDAFIDDMAQAYGWADLVICRAGALTVAELAASGVASILVPFPHAVDDHQTANAQYLVDVGAAEWVPQAQLSVEVLRRILVRYSDDAQHSTRQKLLSMARAARRAARISAVDEVVGACLEAARV